MVKGPTTQISPLKTRSKNYIGFTSASEAGFTTSKATGTGLKQIKGVPNASPLIRWQEGVFGGVIWIHMLDLIENGGEW